MWMDRWLSTREDRRKKEGTLLPPARFSTLADCPGESASPFTLVSSFKTVTYMHKTL